MKKQLILLLFLTCFAVIAFGQTFDIAGTYLGEIEGMRVRIDVESLDLEELQFSFISLDEESPVFISDYAETGEYHFEDDGDMLKVTFEDDTCTYTNGNRAFTFEKKNGDPLSHPGYYSLRVEEDVELVLKVEEADLQYSFIFEAWEIETVLQAPSQAGNTFTLTGDWGDTVTLVFTPDLCIFSGENEGQIELVRQSL